MVLGPKCYFAVFSNEVCKRFKKDPNIVPSRAFSLSWDITPVDNEELTCVTIEDEITQVIHQISSLKASGLVCVNAIFYQNAGTCIIRMHIVWLRLS